MPKPPPKRSLGGTRWKTAGQPPAQPQQVAAGAVAPTAWEQQARWYDELQGAEGGDLYASVLLPRVCERLQAKPGQRVLDVCCGQGVLGRRLAAIAVRSTGIDAAPSLIAAARQRAGTDERYVLGDARRLEQSINDGPYDHGALIMALQDLEAPHVVLNGMAALIAPLGRLVVALTHPCFRVPKRSRFEDDLAEDIRYRRIDSYLSTCTATIVTHPGQGDASPTTTSFHRPLGFYVNALGAAGFAVVAMDELISPRRGTQGRASPAEDRAVREFPLFCVLTAVRLP